MFLCQSLLAEAPGFTQLCSHLSVCPVLCFAFMNDAHMWYGAPSVSACGLVRVRVVVPCCGAELFFLFFFYFHERCLCFHWGLLPEWGFFLLTLAATPLTLPQENTGVALSSHSIDLSPPRPRDAVQFTHHFQSANQVYLCSTLQFEVLYIIKQAQQKIVHRLGKRQISLSVICQNHQYNSNMLVDIPLIMFQINPTQVGF